MRALALLPLALVIAGCSQAPPPSGGNASSAAPAVAPAATAAAPAATGVASAEGSACDRQLIGQADVQPLLTGPITSVKPSPGDAKTCVFATAGFSSITVTLWPGEGKQTLESWHKGPATPLPGVGDDAVWEADLKEVVANRGETLCTVTAMGSEAAPATAQSEGALCNKIFAGLQQ
jgi:hypothetical protein